MTDYSELVERMRAYPANRLCIQVADALEAQAKRIAELDKAAKDAIKEVSYWSTETGKRDARIAELEAALKPFAYDVAECFQDDEDTEIPVKIRGIRAARAALKGEK